MHLELDPNEVNIVLQHLEMGQFRTVAPLLMKIQAQIMAQQAEKPASVPEEVIPAGGTD